MYLRTPKRYQKQRRHVFSMRWLWLWILTPLVVVGGWQIYENRDRIAPPIQQLIVDFAENARQSVETITAPTPMPTEDPARRLQVANSAWGQGSIDEALREYELVLPGLPNEVQPHYRYTFGLIMQGRAQDALEAAERTVTANPYSSDAWAIRSYALNENGRQGEAIASAMQALQLDSRSARATAFLAEAYFDSNQVERALTTAERALGLNEDSFEALYIYGRIQAESLFDFPEAMSAFERAYAVAPNMPYVGVQLAAMQFRQENPDAGFATLQNIVELNPRNADALYFSALYTYTLNGDANQALDYLNRCVETNPSSTTCLWYLGQVYFGMGDNQRAAQAFMRVIDVGTTNSRHYLSAGRINATLNNCNAAINYLRDGYDVEAARPVPDTTRLADFDEALRGCGVGGGPTAVAPAVEAEEALDIGDGTLTDELSEEEFTE